MMISRTIANYKILKELGAGGMGTVYLAENLSINTKVAIKMLHPHLVKNEKIKSRFIKEARAQAILDHPYITKVIDFVSDDQGLFIVLEFVEGEMLSDFIFKNKRQLSETEANQYMSKILDAVGYAHRHDVLHCDLKLANIMITPSKDIKILGFGIEKFSSESSNHTSTGSLLGSPLYMSPEQVTNGNIDFRSNIYSLGVIYLEMLTGTPVYDQNNTSEFEIYNQIVKQLLPRLKEVYKIDADRAQEVVDTATAKIPAARFQSCEEFKSSLLKESEYKPQAEIPAAVNVAAIPTVPKSSVVDKKQKNKTKPVIIGVILLLVALLGGGGYYFANEFTPKTEDESTVLLREAENYFKSGEYREAFKVYNTVLSQFPENSIAKQRVGELIGQSDIFQRRSVDSVMQLYLQTTSLENFNPKDSILGYKITTGFNHIFGELDNMKNNQKILDEAIILDNALNDLEISHHYFSASALFATGEGMEAMEILKMASEIGPNSHVEELKDSIENSFQVGGAIEEKTEIVSKRGTVSFRSAQIPPIFNGCPYNMKASELRECFNNKLKEYLDTNISPKNYNHLPLKSGIQNSKFSFVVGKDGNVKDVQVVAPHQKIENDIHYALQNLKGIKPGFQNNVPVEVEYKSNYSFDVVSNRKPSEKPLMDGFVVENRSGSTKSAPKKSISMLMADRAPVFPGCEDENKKSLVNCSTENIDHFIKEYIDYRGISQAGVPEGPQSFLVKFQINEEGGVQNIEVRTPLDVMVQEVIKVVKLMPQMEPGIYKSQPAIVDYSASLTIQIE